MARTTREQQEEIARLFGEMPIFSCLVKLSPGRPWSEFAEDVITNLSRVQECYALEVQSAMVMREQLAEVNQIFACISRLGNIFKENNERN